MQSGPWKKIRKQSGPVHPYRCARADLVDMLAGQPRWSAALVAALGGGTGGGSRRRRWSSGRAGGGAGRRVVQARGGVSRRARGWWLCSSRRRWGRRSTTTFLSMRGQQWEPPPPQGRGAAGDGRARPPAFPARGGGPRCGQRCRWGGREKGLRGRMRVGGGDPCRFGAWRGTRRKFSGRVRPSSVAKLDSGFATGQGREAIFV
jgi:hypothetical protein